MVRIIFGVAALLLLYTGRLCAAPLEYNFALAPSSLSSAAEKTAAFREARLRVLAAAKKYERTPYRYGGLDKRGLDCSGLVYLSFHDALGISVPRNTWGLYSWIEKIALTEARPGDLLFFNTTGSGSVSHVGIFLGDGRFIHAASDGPVTGVIYSSLDERYWSRTYTGAGRALPQASMPDMSGGSAGTKIAATAASSSVPVLKPGKEYKREQELVKKDTGLIISFAAAPTWNFSGNGNILRGVAGQVHLGAAVKPLGIPMVFGMELRSEWDQALGVFRVPFTFSWGPSEKFRVFAGPVISFGSAELAVSGENRRYSGGTNWLGAVGITAAPVAFTIAGKQFAPYGELAWQSYLSDGNTKNLNADFAAGFRFSTGLRCSWQL